MKKFNIKLNNDMRMLKTVLQFLVDYTLSFAGIPKIAASQAVILEKYDGVNALQLQNVSVTEGGTDYKDELQHVMCNLAGIVAGQGFALADETNTPEDILLKAKYNFTAPKLFSLTDQQSPITCLSIYNTANGQAADLLSSGVTPLVLSDLLDSIGAFNSEVTHPTGGQTVYSENTKEQEKLVREAKVVLKNQLDRRMLNFSGDSLLFGKYKSSRRILNLGSRKTGVKGIVVDSEGHFIYAIEILVVEFLLSMFTDIGGVYVIETKKGGIVKVQAKYNGVVVAEKELVEVKVGAATRVDFVLPASVGKLYLKDSVTNMLLAVDANVVMNDGFSFVVQNGFWTSPVTAEGVVNGHITAPGYQAKDFSKELFKYQDNVATVMMTPV